jgi:large subunit ribosomal protein L21
MADKQKKYAVIKTAGKQFTVAAGDKFSVDRVEAKEGETVTFPEILLVAEGDNVQVGTPQVAGASVKAKVLAHDKNDKLVIYKKRRRKGYTKKKGHRQSITTFVVESIEA